MVSESCFEKEHLLQPAQYPALTQRHLGGKAGRILNSACACMSRTRQECFDMHGFIRQEVRRLCAIYRGTSDPRSADANLVLGVFSGLVPLQETLRATAYTRLMSCVLQS